MAEQQYRFGGPIPEGARRLKERRENREQLAIFLEIEARRADAKAPLSSGAGAFAHMTATEVSEALASETQKKLADQVTSLKASLESEWERRGVDMSTLYHPAYGGFVRPKPLAVDRLGFLLPSSEATEGSESRFPKKSRESLRASTGCGACCGCTSDPSRSTPPEAQASAERAIDPPKC